MTLLKKFSFSTILILGLSINVKSQMYEFGVGAGIMNYAGDLVRGYDLNTTTPAFTGFARFNLSESLTLRANLLTGNVKGVETPIDPFAIERNYSFNNSLYELSGIFEYHFIDFKNRKSIINYSPYIFAGFGGILFPSANENQIQPVVPIGAGFKYFFRRKYTLGIEAGARKTFFDELDGISDGDLAIKNYQYGNPNDTDWYFFTGISLSITLFTVPCPFPNKPNNGLFD